MTHSRYISLIFLAGLISWIAWFLILFKLSPFESSGVALLFFFLTLFIALSCTFSVIGFYFRLLLFRNEIFYSHIGVSLRQGVLLSLVASLSLVLQMLRVLSWWSGFLLVIMSLLLEFYFSAKDSEFST